MLFYKNISIAFFNHFWSNYTNLKCCHIALFFEKLHRSILKLVVIIQRNNTIGNRQVRRRIVSDRAKSTNLINSGISSLSSIFWLHTLLIKKSKFGSGLKERFETIFFRHVGHSLLPRISAVVIHSEQKRWRHSFFDVFFVIGIFKNPTFVVIVQVKRSRQIGQHNSVDSVLAVTLILVWSVMALCGRRA